MDIVLLIGSLAIILVAAELFTNGIEWLGHKLKLAEGAVGSVLAAVATAMPETLIPVIAILGPVIVGGTASESAQAVGVGAILGAPFMLSTLAMFVTGIAIVIFARRGRRTTDMRVNTTDPRARRRLLRGRLRHRHRHRIPAVRARLAEVGGRRVAVRAVRRLRAPALHRYAGGERSGGAQPAAPHPRSAAEHRAHARDRCAPRGPFGHRRRASARDRHRPGGRSRWGSSSSARRCSSGRSSTCPRSSASIPTILALIIAPIATELPGEVQQRAVGAQRQGHPGHGQHHRRDGLPERAANRARSPLHELDLHRRQRDPLRIGRGCLRARRSSSSGE